MPVQGNAPNIRANKKGQMSNPNSGHNPRGKGKPRAKPKGAGDNKGGQGGPPRVKDFLSGDITYKSQVTDLKKNLENFLTDWRGDREDVHETFGTTMDKMKRERQRSREQILNDFTGRGLLHSGMFAKSSADYNTEWGQRKNELVDDRNERIEDLNRNKSLFREEVKSLRRNARDEAIRRRAQRFGLT